MDEDIEDMQYHFENYIEKQKSINKQGGNLSALFLLEKRRQFQY